jgi:hypothetical protein
MAVLNFHHLTGRDLTAGAGSLRNRPSGRTPLGSSFARPCALPAMSHGALCRPTAAGSFPGLAVAEVVQPDESLSQPLSLDQAGCSAYTLPSPEPT